MYRKIICMLLALCALPLLLAACIPVDFSPDGKHIVFCWSTDNATHALYTINTDGTGLQALPDGASGLLARWSPDGKSILYVDSRQHLKLYDVLTGKTQQVAVNTDLAFAWSQDGRRFAAIFTPQKSAAEIRYYASPDGALISRMPLPPRWGRASLLEMTWLRDTDTIAFVGMENNGPSGIYLARDTGITRVDHSNNVLGLRSVADGRKLLWACRSAGLKESLLSLYTFDPTTRTIASVPFPAHLAPINSDPRRLPDEIEYVAFSPDGVWMALVVGRSISAAGGLPQLSKTIYVARMDGTAAHLVQQTSPYPRDGDEAADQLLPSWSKDGKRLAIVQWASHGASITLYNADGSGKFRLPLPTPSYGAQFPGTQSYLSRRYLKLVSHGDPALR